jgi:D-alanyl-D-alanine dipeptidase
MFRRLALSLFFAATLFAQAPVFRIQPVRPVEELRREALAAKPPAEQGDFRPSDLVELTKLDPTIKLDIRYASSNNFLSTPIYTQARAFLQRPAAEAVARANQELKKLGYGLHIHDGYRPWYVTKIFWDATPPDKHEFVADPSQGSHHNRGCAVDLTLYDLKTGKPVEMPSVYDEMSKRAYPNYAGGTPEQTRLRDLLRTEMEKQGFTVYESEWWHFDYKDWKQYRIENIPFEILNEVPRPGSHRNLSIDKAAPAPMSADINGTVLLWCIVNTEGRVSDIKVVKSLRKDLDQRALEAVKSWNFEPARKDGKTVAVQIHVEVKFTAGN